MAIATDAQQKTITPVGEYYLQGVMETASGFRVNKDSTFQFFFSYGALDREGSGTWRLDGNSLIFNSEKRTTQDFTPGKTESVKGKPISIKITGAPSQIVHYVYGRLKSGGNTEEVKANRDGIITFKASKADLIELLFELCPDKTSVFRIENNTLNYFEFKLEHSITDVAFDNFRLQLHPNELKGPHPLMETKSFVYKKVDH